MSSVNDQQEHGVGGVRGKVRNEGRRVVKRKEERVAKKQQCNDREIRKTVATFSSKKGDDRNGRGREIKKKAAKIRVPNQRKSLAIALRTKP